jgi:hypothetical protein
MAKFFVGDWNYMVGGILRRLLGFLGWLPLGAF